LTAASHIRYPRHRLKLYLLDDGGTEEKLHGPSRKASQAARDRSEQLKALCARLGVQYLTRRTNRHAKAGNLNAALMQTSGDLILTLDADHVPTQEILEATVGYFLRDSRLSFVQTAHFFFNPDPIERNLGTFGRMPSEHEMFYSVVQCGLDFWNATLFCGSAAVLRRRHLMDIGGFAGTSITEDAETSLELHAHGLRGIYLDRALVAGRAPESFSGLIAQRSRWTQGMLQILLLKNPLFKRGLSLPQRLCYLKACTFWLFPFSRLVFTSAPLWYLFFGLRIFEATLAEFVLFAVPHVLCSWMMANHLFGRYRWPFVSDVYELVLSVYLIGPALATLVRPRKPHFRVTPKGETMDRDHITPTALPIVVIFATLLVAAVVGVWRYQTQPLERDHLLIIMAWNLLNLILATGALGVMFERAVMPSTGWILRNKPVNLVTRNWEARALLRQASLQAARLVIDMDEAEGIDPGERYAQMQIVLPGSVIVSAFQILIEREQMERGQLVLDCWFLSEGRQDDHGLVALCFGDSELWQSFLASRRGERWLIGGLMAIWLSGVGRTIAMIRSLLLGQAIARAGSGSTDLVRYEDGAMDHRRW
jgi:cellulose synthase (UDP-forming)